MTLVPGGRVGIVMMSAVGDTVHVLPVLNALERHDPTIHITWILQPLPASLVAGHPAIDRIVRYDPARGWRAPLDVRRAFSDERLDLVLDLQVAFKGGVVTALLPAPVKLGFDRRRARDLNWLFTTHRIPAHPPQHVGEQYLEFVRALGVDPEPPAWHLGPRGDELAWQQSFRGEVGTPFAAINIATSHPDRDWFADRWAPVIDHLHDTHGIRSVLVGGASPRERSIQVAIERCTRHRPVDALGSGFRRLVAIIDAAEVVLALDSAPLHIAVALGRPVVSLMANADPRRTGPFRAFHDLIVDAYHDPGEQVPVSMVRRWGRMHRITVDDVLARLDVWNTRYRTVR